MPSNAYHHGDLKNALIQAGVEILAQEGTPSLSLRKVAQKAGVSHAAPYAHFADKQELIAAICTQGFTRLFERVEAASAPHLNNPGRLLVEVAWAYVQFALDYPAQFKVMFSGILEKEHEYPEFIEMSQKNFGQLVGLAERLRQAGLFQPAAGEVLALGLWSLVHGFISLYLENQFSHALLESFTLKELLIEMLNQFTGRMIEMEP